MFIVGYIIYGIIWGFVCIAVITNKGYDEGWGWWFLWGFIFGIFAFLVAISKPQVETHQYGYSSYEPSYSSIGSVVSSGQSFLTGVNEWKCTRCGRINDRSVGTCACGLTKQQSENWCFEETHSGTEEKQVVSQDNISETAVKTVHSDQEIVDLIKQYKELLDMGAISEEEYEKKKQELLEK